MFQKQIKLEQKLFLCPLFKNIDVAYISSKLQTNLEPKASHSLNDQIFPFIIWNTRGEAALPFYTTKRLSSHLWKYKCACVQQLQLWPLLHICHYLCPRSHWKMQQLIHLTWVIWGILSHLFVFFLWAELTYVWKSEL